MSITISDTPLIKEWSNLNQSDLKPEEITLGSHKIIIWQCIANHTWSARVYDRARGKSCPFCAGLLVIPGKTDLKTVNPDLANDWDYVKNGDLKPEHVSAHSNRKVWWICQHGHSWNSVISNRSQGKGCPFCANKLPILGETDLVSKNPELAIQWNQELNGDLNPEDFTSMSHKKVWWTCKKGHTWKAAIEKRTSGTSCPYCSGHKPITGKTDLKTVNPYLSSEWDYDMNGALRPEDISAHSRVKIWWACYRGHKWLAPIDLRTNGSGCPYCSGRKSIPGETDLKTINPTMAEEWAYNMNGELKPEDVLPNSGKMVWWICSNGHYWQATVHKRTSKGLCCPNCKESYENNKY